MPEIVVSGKSKMLPLDRYAYEKDAKQSGFKIIAGIDEAGRGPLAGPVVAACIVLPDDIHGLEDVQDSKKINAAKRRQWYMILHERACDIGVGIVDAQTIDRINILQATFLAMERAVKSMTQKPEFYLIDGNRMPSWARENAKTIISGEKHSISIAAASIIAKETRDRIMKDYDHLYPEWGFAKHKGYGTTSHLEAIRVNGICELHRKTFAPIPQMKLTFDIA